MNDVTMLDCRSFTRALEAARDHAPERQAGPFAAAELRLHAGSCSECAGLLAAETGLRADLARWRRASTAAAQVPPGFASRVTRRARAAALPRTGTAGTRWGFALGAAACLSVALLLAGSVPEGELGSAAGGQGPVVARAGAPVLAADDAAAGPGDAALGPLLWSNGSVDIVAPAGADFAVPRKTATTALLVEYRF
jgi:hypothetical protein